MNNSYEIQQVKKKLREEIAFADETDAIQFKRVNQRHQDLIKYTEALEKRVDRLELAHEGLVALLKERGQVSDAAMEIAIARIDLADGIEDGKKDSSSNAEPHETTPCPHCSRPINPQRTHCVFCFKPISEALSRKIVAKAAAKPAPKPMTKCSACFREVPKRDTYFSDTGVVCSHCYRPR